MENNNSLNQLQQQYFDFCTQLIRKIPFEQANPEVLLDKAFFLRDNLDRAITLAEMNHKNECLEKINSIIQKLEQEQESPKSTNEDGVNELQD